MEAYTSLWSYLLLYFGYYLGQCLSAKRLHPPSSRCWPLLNFEFPSPRYRKWKNLLSIGGNSSAKVLPVAGKLTEIVRKTLVYNDYFHLHVFCFSYMRQWRFRKPTMHRIKIISWPTMHNFKSYMTPARYTNIILHFFHVDNYYK